MKKEDFERLKAVCEKEGFDLELFDSNEPLYSIKKKDIWYGVEFAEFIGFDDSEDFTKNKIYKVNGVLGNRLNICNDNSGCKNGWQKIYFKPSTESAYINQLKKEAFERFGEIKDGDEFINTRGHRIESNASGFEYEKDRDILCCGLVYIYESGKWATRVKERVKVDFDGGNLQSRQFYFIYGKDAESKMQEKGCFKVGELLASQLEKYLNGEIE